MSPNVNIFCLEQFYTIRYDTFLHIFLCSTKYQKLVFYAGIPLTQERKFLDSASRSAINFFFQWLRKLKESHRGGSRQFLLWCMKLLCTLSKEPPPWLAATKTISYFYHHNRAFNSNSKINIYNNRKISKDFVYLENYGWERNFTDHFLLLADQGSLFLFLFSDFRSHFSRLAVWR